MNERLRRVNELLYSARYLPYWGWHDDHVDADGTDDYRPAVMQVKAEFAALAEFVGGVMGFGGNCLQLGMGNCRASHDMWLQLFGHVTTISNHGGMMDQGVLPGLSTHDPEAQRIAQTGAPYDFLWIDAGHSFEDVKADHEDYGPMVRKGGIVAFHDVLRRPGYPEVGVPEYLDQFRNEPLWIAAEPMDAAVGIYCRVV